MIKLFIGGKGSGKTKALIELVNGAANTSKGNVVCIEKCNKLKLDITYKARLIDTDYYGVCWSGSFDLATEQYANAKELLERVIDATIVNHQMIAENVYCTTYSNGIKIFVNYGTQAYKSDGVNISPQGYAMQKEAAK